MQVTDLFTAGLGFELGGAFFLARGLIAGPAELNRLASAFWESSPYQAVAIAKDRIDAIAGLLGLSFGFVCQTVGYVAILAGAGERRAVGPKTS